MPHNWIYFNCIFNYAENVHFTFCVYKKNLENNIHYSDLCDNFIPLINKLSLKTFSLCSIPEISSVVSGALQYVWMKKQSLSQERIQALAKRQLEILQEEVNNDKSPHFLCFQDVSAHFWPHKENPVNDLIGSVERTCCEFHQLPTCCDKSMPHLMPL